MIFTSMEDVSEKKIINDTAREGEQVLKEIQQILDDPNKAIGEKLGAIKARTDHYLNSLLYK